MKRVLLFLISLLFLVVMSVAQQISRHEADSMIIALDKNKSGADRINLLLNLAQFHIFKLGENKIDLDSAAVYINKAKSLNKLVHTPDVNGYLLLTESFITKEKGNKEEGKKMVEKAIYILKSGNKYSYLGQALFELSMYYNYLDSAENEKKNDLVNQSIAAFSKASDYKRKGRALEMLGNLQLEKEEIDKAIVTLKEALAVYDSINYPIVQGTCALLGGALRQKRDFNQALFYLLKALKSAQAVNDTSSQMAQIYNNLGLLYHVTERYQTSAKYLEEAIKFSTKYNDEYGTFFLLMSLSNAYNELEQPGEALKALDRIPRKYLTTTDVYDHDLIVRAYLRTYMNLKQYENARPYCDTLLQIESSPLLKGNRKSNGFRLIATYYFEIKQFSKSRFYINRAIHFADEANFSAGHIVAYKLLYKLDSAEGNFRAAFVNLNLYKSKMDSMIIEKKETQFEMLRVEYDVGMKEDSIRSINRNVALLTQKNNLQQKNLKQASLIKNITVAGIILALIITVLLYRLYRQKQQKNLLLQLQKEETNKSNQELKQLNEEQQKLLTEKDWLVKEIHHRVKNNLQMVVSLLNAQTEFLTHPSAIDAIKESRERMQAIAIIHQKLYQLDNSTQINMRSYINELINNIQHSFADNEKINFIIDVADVSLDISQSVPLGLILNEAITNAVKYAYPKSEKGMIQISLKHSSIDKLQLKIADNGKGLPADVDIEHSNTLGIQLIRLFSEQLEGDLYFINNNGLGITLNFKFEDKNFESHKVSA